MRGPIAEAIVFFFSSRRRHTRWPRDWSSDVCSSDLCSYRHHRSVYAGLRGQRSPCGRINGWHGMGHFRQSAGRSEERRVGKEGRARGRAEEERKSNERWEGAEAEGVWEKVEAGAGMI